MRRSDFTVEERRIMGRVTDTLISAGMPRNMAERIVVEHMREERMRLVEAHAATMLHAVCRG